MCWYLYWGSGGRVTIARQWQHHQICPGLTKTWSLVTTLATLLLLLTHIFPPGSRMSTGQSVSTIADLLGWVTSSAVAGGGVGGGRSGPPVQDWHQVTSTSTQSWALAHFTTSKWKREGLSCFVQPPAVHRSRPQKLILSSNIPHLAAV